MRKYDVEIACFLGELSIDKVIITCSTTIVSAMTLKGSVYNMQRGAVGYLGGAIEEV